MSIEGFNTRLHQSTLREQLINHKFFDSVKMSAITREQVAVFIAQWWHPLHYFPVFLARCISVLPEIAAKCAIARILDQEVGEGNPQRAHEVIYCDTMKICGFAPSEVTGMPPFAETKALVDGYWRASAAPLPALGFIFATEVADLAMVSGIGVAVERATGVKDLEWVNIHLKQESDHVVEADNAVLANFKAGDEPQVLEAAAEMWRLWISFFDRLQIEAFGESAQQNSQQQIKCLQPEELSSPLSVV
jgi:pyrroloquinoline quinone (PQQ) biosynthesis protein C